MGDVRCPTCGALCRVVSSREGTSYYEPIPGPEYVVVEADIAGLRAQNEGQRQQIRELRILLAWMAKDIAGDEAMHALSVRTEKDANRILRRALVAGIREVRGG